MGVEEFNFADDALIEKSNAVPGFTGPKDLKAKKFLKVLQRIAI